ncbi:MAG: hypothetical protein JXM73_17205 [Anaerolineae bacterium]|nr:hypothetical protein [Anaerolineae bacterium]
MLAKALQEQYITDRKGRKTHIILPIDIFERILPLLEDGFEVTEAYVAQERVAATDWDAPEMGAYDDL